MKKPTEQLLQEAKMHAAERNVFEGFDSELKDMLEHLLHKYGIKKSNSHVKIRIAVAEKLDDEQERDFKEIAIKNTIAMLPFNLRVLGISSGNTFLKTALDAGKVTDDPDLKNKIVIGVLKMFMHSDRFWGNSPIGKLAEILCAIGNKFDDDEIREALDEKLKGLSEIENLIEKAIKPEDEPPTAN